MQIILENNNPTQKEILQPEIYRINVKNGIMGRFIHQIFAIEKRKKPKTNSQIYWIFPNIRTNWNPNIPYRVINLIRKII